VTEDEARKAIEEKQRAALTEIDKAKNSALEEIDVSKANALDPRGSEQFLRWLHDTYSEQIVNEYQLIGTRMSWLMGATAFLFTALALISANLQSASAQINILTALKYIIPLLGLLLTLSVILGVLSAEAAIYFRKGDRAHIEEKIVGILRKEDSDLENKLIRKTRTLKGAEIWSVRIAVPRNSPRHIIGLASTTLVLLLILGAWSCVSYAVYGGELPGWFETDPPSFLRQH
jgi:hypothetical protein